MPRTPSPRTGPLVCVVDNDPSLRRALWRLVSGAGFSAATFASAEDELYESLAASGRSIPVIFITGHDSASTRDRARAAGAAGYLTKPFHHDQLIDAIAEVM